MEQAPSLLIEGSFMFILYRGGDTYFSQIKGRGGIVLY